MNKPTRSAKSGIFICLLTLLTLSTSIKAQELDKILEALDKKDLGQTQTKEEISKDVWIDSNSNLAKIFNASGRGVYNILDWLGDVTDKDFKFMSKIHKKHNEYISLNVTYNTRAKNQILMTVLVLHPKHLSLIGTGLLEEFHNQEPPGLSADATEKMSFKNINATYYQHRKQGCSLLFKLPQNTTLNIYDKKCTDNSEIIRLAELLDIERLTQKLNS